MAWISNAIVRRYTVSFYIQAGNPRVRYRAVLEQRVLSEAIEDMFLLNTENVILSWNYIGIPVSYKYDISYMIGDILNLAYALQTCAEGNIKIDWLPDTFRCDWSVRWENNIIEIESYWECTVGHLEDILNKKNKIKITVNEFLNEWKKVLENIITGLNVCGYDPESIPEMKKLLDLYNSIKGVGVLYQ